MIHQIERHADPSTIDCTLRIRCSITPGGKHQLEAHFVHSTLQSVISWKHILYIPLCKKCDQLEAHCVHTTLQKCYQLEAHFVHTTLQKVLLSQVRRATCYTHHTHQFNLYVLQDNYPLFQARQATCYTHHLLFQARIATC